MAKKINLVLCWHMHQPYYQEGLDGEYRLPWVYLHGIKDYADMAAHLERYPAMKVVVNFAPVLLEQLDDYAQQLERFLADGSALKDPLLNILSGATPVPEDTEARRELISACRRAHAPRMIEPFKHFHFLSHLFDPMPDGDPGQLHNFCLEYLDEQYFIDLLMWYHLAWMGQSLKDTPQAKKLMEKGKRFSAEDRRSMMTIIHVTMAGLIPRYRALADRGQIELSMTPYTHPIVPLLIDFKTMQEARPGAPMPVSKGYPGGLERSRWHMRKGIEIFERYFGRKPEGVWLSEGGLSRDGVKLLQEFGIRWSASGETVWKNSCLATTGCDPNDVSSGMRPLFEPYRLDKMPVRLFFRDDGLSDLIGFEYRNWHGDDAVANFVRHLETIGKAFGDDANHHVISVILDGENAWEYYPENGHYFLDALYKKLADHPQIRVQTFAGLDGDVQEGQFTTLVAGSWVYGTFSTWMGDRDKNNAWDMLVAAKQAYDEQLSKKTFSPEQLVRLEKQLAICESSDWFWWFGEYNPAGSVSDFDKLFRLQLRKLYEMLQLPAPATLDSPVSYGGGEMENSGTMRRGS
jgi:alpha-amylase/alpha-mannosidase (GH57 family)